jgi:type IV pilus assembly protein PilW
MMSKDTRPTCPRQRQLGLSLIELMISMVIGLLILGGMIGLFISNKQTYQYNDELARLQENNRMAIDRLERTLRMAGHIGCPTLQDAQGALVSDESIAANPAILLDTMNAIYAEKYNPASPGIVGTVGRTGVTGTDVITVRFGQGASTTLDTAVNDAIDTGTSSVVIRDNALGFTQGEAIVISDCKSVGIARVSNTPASGNSVTLQFSTNGGYNSSDGFTKVSFGSDVRLMRMSNLSLFIGPSSNTNRQGNAFNSLYMASEGFNSAVFELVEGVVDMVVTYGIPATSGDGEVAQYVTSTAVTNWNDVMAVKITLLMSSVDDGVVDNQAPIVFNGTAYNDHRMYTTASTTIALRRTF